ncbi:TetR family transcriptional regulator [Paenibacillus gorillae]|uniref:acyl-CoA-like ligand-binding transcription factor n=1 Tax=Paenibacillus gorillae TaxID=1243662 RepID=UPI0004BB9C9C|nr:TetR family transcriptional regulator [Paenibacillus gorillae]
MSSDKKQATGLRERKKAKTIAAVQAHALRLFHEHGYHETTVDQIAAAAEISPSTFFRYFPTKEDVLIIDNYDPLLIQAFRAQPSELSLLEATRNAMTEGIDKMSVEEMETVRQRIQLIMSVPELRAATLNNQMMTLQLIVELAAERLGRQADDLAVQTFAGAIIGVSISVMLYYSEHPEADFRQLQFDALNRLKDGFPL